MSCHFASHQTKNIHIRLVGKRPSGNVEKAPSPPQVAPLCGRLPLCGENYVRIILQPHKFENRSNKAYEESCPSDQLKNRKVFFHRYAYNRNGPCSVIPTGACLTLWKGLNRASGKTMPSQKTRKLITANKGNPKQELCPDNLGIYKMQHVLKDRFAEAIRNLLTPELPQTGPS